jgi:hypothetical protein
MFGLEWAGHEMARHLVVTSNASFLLLRINPNIYKFSPYRKENTTFHHYKDQLINVV